MIAQTIRFAISLLLFYFRPRFGANSVETFHRQIWWFIRFLIKYPHTMWHRPYFLENYCLISFKFPLINRKKPQCLFMTVTLSFPCFLHYKRVVIYYLLSILSHFSSVQLGACEEGIQPSRMWLRYSVTLRLGLYPLR